MSLFEENIGSMKAGKLDGPLPEIYGGITASPCKAGLLRCRGTGANQSVPPTSAAMVANALLGVSLLAPSLPGVTKHEAVQEEGEYTGEVAEVFYQYDAGEVVDHVKHGNICMYVEQDVTPHDPVFVRIVQGADGEMLGALRKDAGADVTVFEGVLINIESAADSAYRAVVDGKQFSYSQGSAGTAAAKATGLAAAINGQAASANYPDLAAVVESSTKVRVRYASVTNRLPTVEVFTADAALLTIEESGTLESPEAVQVSGIAFTGPNQGDLVRVALALPA